MNNPRHLIDIDANSPVERALAAGLQKERILFEVQPNLFNGTVRYQVMYARDLLKARNVLYHVLNTPKSQGGNQVSSPTPSYEAKRSRLENNAKEAYEIFAHRTGATVPWERLPLDHWAAWKELVESFQGQDAKCTCGKPLQCVNCEYNQLECSCGELLTCPVCDEPLPGVEEPPTSPKRPEPLNKGGQ